MRKRDIFLDPLYCLMAIVTALIHVGITIVQHYPAEPAIEMGIYAVAVIVVSLLITFAARALYWAFLKLKRRREDRLYYASFSKRDAWRN